MRSTTPRASSSLSSVPSTKLRHFSRPSSTFAAFSSRGDRYQRAQRIIDRFRIGKSLGQLRINENDVDSAAIPADVLAADAAGEIVLRSHLTSSRLRGRLLHNSVSHAWLRGER